MANIVNESVTVSVAGGLVHILLTQVHDDGIDMGGPIVLDVGAASWLADEVDRAAEVWGFAEETHVIGPDHFTLYIGGSEMQPFVHVHNYRDPSAPEGKDYALGMTPDAARSLATQLRSVAGA